MYWNIVGLQAGRTGDMSIYETLKQEETKAKEVAEEEVELDF